jgi:membrane-associated phospholipid phosphatase
MRAVTSLERIWFAYIAAVIAVALLADGGGSAHHRPWSVVALHLVMAALQLAHVAAARRGPADAARRRRCALALVGLPVVFSALAWLLPAVHPEPFEYVWRAVDIAICGDDVSRLAFDVLPGWSVLPLQLVYASFYFVPMAAVLTVGAFSGAAAFDRALAIVVGSFLCSYLGYLLFPTLAPKVVLPADAAATVDGVTGFVRKCIDAAETNPWDCFPSGHTMLSLTSLLVVWRWARPAVPCCLLVVVPICTSTVLLRYHWPIDVVVGALLTWPVARMLDRMLDRDGAPPP